MRHAILIAGMAALTTAAPALAEAPMSLHGAGPTTEIAQAQVPLYPPAAPSIVVPTAPPPPQAETLPPAPSPTYVWEPGHWSWNGVQYFWNPGKYVERPTVSATYVPGLVRRPLGLSGLRQQHSPGKVSLLIPQVGF
jgi:hypothetical protein